MWLLFEFYLSTDIDNIIIFILDLAAVADQLFIFQRFMEPQCR